jgi:hypothetical protein
MKNRKNHMIFYSGLLLFLITFGLSVLFQSAILLYIASAMPMLVVPFLPDLQSSQFLKTRRNVEIVRLNEGDPASETLVITFEPERIYWNRKYLYISLDKVESVSQLQSKEHTVAMTVLRHDLKFQHKKNRIGIYLPNLIERLGAMPYTPNEVNRLVLRMDDVRDAIMPETMRVSIGQSQMKLPM